MADPNTLEAHGLPDTKFGQAMLESLRSFAQFYREYVTSDHNHEHVSRIPQDMALALIQLSPYRPFLSSYMIGFDAEQNKELTPRYLMNKGAVRLTVSPDHAEAGIWTEEQLEGIPSEWDSRSDLWVYCHDGSYWLTRPRQKR